MALIPPKPDGFDKLVTTELMKDPEGRLLLQAYTMQELWEFTWAFTIKRQQVGREGAKEQLTDFYNKAADSKFNN